ncbi:NTP transferase domain-containing protein [Cohnella faecalis]|uniref:nucleotidyltransferase family protein n=1 Tax=Cohnella faecalis TaxID=2315694 RepID=UPI0036229F3C
MGRPKLGLELAPGEPLGIQPLRALLGCAEVGEVACVVRRLGETEGLYGRLLASLAGIDDSRLRVMECADAGGGMSRSLRCGVEALEASDCPPDAIVVVLGDQPFVTSGVLTKLIDGWHRAGCPDYFASSPSDEGEAQPPALFGKTMFPALRGQSGDKGARQLFRSPEWIGGVMTIADRSIFADADTEEDLQTLRRMWRTKRGR